MADTPAPLQFKAGRITEPQKKRFCAISIEHKWAPQEVDALLKKYGYVHAHQISWLDYSKMCDELERGPASKGHKDYSKDNDNEGAL